MRPQLQTRLRQLSRFFLLFTILWCLCVFASACTATWTSEAINIVNLLVPAISSILSILAAFGAGLPANVMTNIKNWSIQSTTDLETVAGLIQQYNDADSAAQPGILNQINIILSTVANNLESLLPEIHITNADSQAKVMSIVQLVLNEMNALINLVPALQNKVTSHDQLKKLMADLDSPQEFKSKFNQQAEQFGAQYQI